MFGTFVISGTVMIHTAGLVFLTRWMNWIVHWFRLHRHSFAKAVAMVTTVLGLFFLHTIEVWVWATAYVSLGVVDDFEAALYFSTVMFRRLWRYHSLPRAPRSRPSTGSSSSAGRRLSGRSLNAMDRSVSAALDRCRSVSQSVGRVFKYAMMLSI
jgi:hypothetical protein